MNSGRGPGDIHPPSQAGRPAADLAVAQKLRQAMSSQQQGQLRDAERLCREVLTESPANPDALHFLGLLEAQQGRYEPALALIDRALGVNPTNAAAFYNKGNALRALGRFEEALASYDRALMLRPDYLAAQSARAAALYRLARYAEAVAGCDRILAAKPDHIDTHVHRGNALIEMKRIDDALESFDRALQLNARHPGALYGRGNAEAAASRFAEAVTNYAAALAASPGNADVLNNRGIALSRLGRQEEAIADFSRAIASTPQRPDSFLNRGNALVQCQRYEDALRDYSEALSLLPDYPEALYGQGQALFELKRYSQAADALERLYRVRPDYPFAPGMLLYAKRSVCDWSGEDDLVSAIQHGIRAGNPVTSPLALLAVSDSPKGNAGCSRILAQNRNLDTVPPLWRGERYTHDRLRVAYVSSDFHTHAVALLMAGVFEQHDRSRFETIALSYGPDDGSAMRARLQRGFDRFIDVREKRDGEIAELLRNLNADIAVDLKGYTGDARPGIFAARPTPIQVNYLGFPGTMGAACYDYIIADRWVIPEEDKSDYDESVVYLPHSYLPHDRQRTIAKQAPTREACGLSGAAFVFCCFNATYKIGRETFDIWMRLLGDVEGSVLWLSSAPPDAVRNLRREAKARGISGDRLIFANFTQTNEEHLARLPHADLFLDTLPYNAHTTASDALWSGLPVLTCVGGSFAGRVGSSLLHAADLPELITASPVEYEALALSLARDRVKLGAIRTKLAANRETAALFDTARFTRHLEAAYAAMHARFRQGEMPSSFAVDPIPSVP